MKHKLTALVVMTALTLTGCSGGTVSATSDQTQTTSTDHTSMVSRVKEFFKGETDKFSVSMPASSLIIEATKDWLVERNLDIRASNDFSDNVCFNSNEVNDHLGYKHQPDSTPKVIIENLSKNRPELKHWANFNAEEICAYTFMRDSALPIGGWYRDIDHGNYARAIFTNAHVANGLQTLIISQLGSSVWKNNLEAKKQIQKVMSEIVKSGQYHALVAEAYTQSQQGITRDLTGKHPAPVHFSLADYDVAGSGVGTVMLRNGAEWFGNGNISGKNYSISMESVEVASMKKDKILNSNEATKTEQAVGESVNVGN